MCNNVEKNCVICREVHSLGLLSNYDFVKSGDFLFWSAAFPIMGSLSIGCIAGSLEHHILSYSLVYTETLVN